MKLSKLLEGIEILCIHGEMEMEISGVSYDSRTTKPGDLFVAVTGYTTDGYKFIPAAIQKGATVVLCEKPPEQDVPYVVVPSSREALAQLGCNWFDHPGEKMTMIGVTGTNGKTTVTYLLKTVLEQALGAKVGLVGTIQNIIGDLEMETERTTPESFDLQALFAQMVAAGCTHVIMEVSSHALALHRVMGVEFAIGVFTNLTEDHLDFHHTMEEYRRAKSILFFHCKMGIFNLDDAAAAAMIAEATCTKFTYSAKKNEADLVAKNLHLKSDRVEFEAITGNEISRMELGIPGGFTVYNALAVVGAALALEIPLGAVAAALKTAKGVKGRVEVVPTPGKEYTVLIDYAHTPDGLENVLRSVKGYCKGRLIAVFGCGGDRDAIKRPIMGRIAASLADIVVITSDNPRTEDPTQIIAQIVKGASETKKHFEIIENRRAAIVWAMDYGKKDDIIVLAGKGHETYQILGTQKTHLDEREEVAAYLAGN